MTGKQMIRMLKKDGWKVMDISGSHHKFQHPVKPGMIIIAHHTSDMGKGLENKILKQAGLK